MSLGKVQHVTVSYQTKQPCFMPVSFDILENHLYWVKGKSGIGKSSLFHAMCHCIPTHIPGKVDGDIQYLGKSIDTLTSLDKVGAYGLVFQQPHWQFATTKVESELAFVLESLNIHKSEIHRQINEMLTLFDIEHLRHQSLNHCSLGQQQLIALASVLIAKPKILFLDECLSAVERKKKKKIIELLNQMKGEMTLFVIDHDASAPWQADEVIQMIRWETKSF